jgi:predicted nucleic acid-binding Zn ribbon protein
MLDNPLTVCKKCGGELKRLIGPGAGPIFKGSGFYQTDYKSNARGNDTVSSAQKNKTKNNSKPEVKTSSVATKKAS